MECIGYINTAYYIEHFEEIVLSMKQLPCSSIYYDEKDDDDRQKWKSFVGTLNNNDTAVLMSFDNAFCSFNDLMFFLKLCSSKNIRIISCVTRWIHLMSFSRNLAPKTRLMPLLK